jgi:hypothetical protein
LSSSLSLSCVSRSPSLALAAKGHTQTSGQKQIRNLLACMVLALHLGQSDNLKLMCLIQREFSFCWVFSNTLRSIIVTSIKHFCGGLGRAS